MANIFTRIFKPEKRSIIVGPADGLGLSYGFSTSPISLSLAMQLSAVYRCVEVISDAIASQTWEYLNFTDTDGWVPDPFDPTCYLLNNEPHPAMSRFSIMKTLVAKVLLEGNGYIIIRRDPYLNPIRLELVSGNVMEYIRRDGTVYYEVQYAGYDIYATTSKGIETVQGEDMIHVLNFSYNGLIGVSTLRHAADTMGLAYASESSAKGFFTSGANMSGILEVEGKLTPEKAKNIKEAWAKAFNITTGQPGGIAVMESGLKFNPVTVNPKDAQMLETRKFNVVEICRFFGVSPSKVFDSENLTYSNIESFQLGFLTDTISPLDSKIEAEFNRKLLRKSKRLKTKLNLNIDDLLRANLDSTANYYSKMFQIGGYDVNAVRAKTRQPKIDGGDKAYVPMNLIPVDTPITQNKKIDKNININQNAVP